MVGYFFRAATRGSLLQRTLRKHFGGVPLSEIVTTAHEFPITSRIDVQTALDQLFATRADKKLLAVHSQMNQETPTLAHSLRADRSLLTLVRCNMMRWISATRFPFAASYEDSLEAKEPMSVLGIHPVP